MVRGFYRVKKFERFQHYKDRNPPWIKLYNDLLDDYAFSCLQDASKLHLILIWLLASRYDNRIPDDPQWIKRKINAHEEINFSALISSGFLEHCDSDSNVLAGCPVSAMPEREGERETEGEKTPAAGAAAEPGTDEPADRAGDAPTPANKPKRRPAGGTKPEHAEVREYFYGQWAKRYGREYPKTHAKDNKHVQWILDDEGVRRSARRAKAIIDRFFADTDRWLTEQRHPLGQLVSRFPRYCVEGPTADDNGFERRPPTDEDLELAFGPDATRNGEAP